MVTGEVEIMQGHRLNARYPIAPTAGQTLQPAIQIVRARRL